MSKWNEEQFAQFYYAKMTGTERERFLKSLRDDAAIRTAYDDYRRVQNAVHSIELEVIEVAESGDHRLNTSEIGTPAKVKKLQPRMVRWMGVAAAVLLLLVAGWWLSSQEQQDTDLLAAYESSRYEEAEIRGVLGRLAGSSLSGRLREDPGLPIAIEQFKEGQFKEAVKGLEQLRSVYAKDWSQDQAAHQALLASLEALVPKEPAFRVQLLERLAVYEADMRRLFGDDLTVEEQAAFFGSIKFKRAMLQALDASQRAAARQSLLKLQKEEGRQIPELSDKIERALNAMTTDN